MSAQLEWISIANEVMERDGFQCQNCGKTTDLLIHHKTPRRHGGTDDLENLTTLCRICHPKIERKAQQWKKPEHTKFIREYIVGVRKLGNSGYISAPKNWVGKKVRVTILEESA